MGTAIKKAVGLVFACIAMTWVYSCANSRKANAQDDKFEVVKDFFDWYANSYEKMNALDFAKPMKDSIYRVDSGQVEEYLALLRHARVFSKKFIDDKIDFFRLADSNLAAIRQTDGPATGFESDLLLLSQEPEYLMGKRKELSISYSQDKAGGHLVAAGFGGDTLIFRLEDSTLLIDSIYRR